MRTLTIRGQQYGGVSRRHWLSQSETLDPEVDFVAIYRNVSQFEFPWETMQSLSLALFRTFAVPAMGRLLHETGEFTARTQRRYDDTALLLEAPTRAGFADPDARAAIRRINQMHRRYDIPDDQMRYVLSTFVVIPRRWIDAYGKRTLTSVEVRASVNYYRALGRHMGITAIPETYAEFERLMDGYESQNFGYDDGGRRVADATLQLLSSFYPRPLAPVVRSASRALMDPPLLTALGYPTPSRPLVAAIRTALRARGAALKLFPTRRTPALVADSHRIRSYPGGFVIGRLGTFDPADARHGR